MANAYVTITIGPISTSGGCISSSKDFDITWRAKFNSLTLCEMMVGATAVGDITSNIVSMGYKQDVSANWILERAGSTLSRTITDIPADTNWHDFRIINTQIPLTPALYESYYYIDGEYLGAIAVNPPTLYMAPFIYVQTYEAATKDMTIDYVSVFSGREPLGLI